MLPAISYSQYNWKLEKDKDGIKVYTSDVANSSFKIVKVECLFSGTYAKLISILSNVSQFDEWIYKNKTSKVIKRIVLLILSIIPKRICRFRLVTGM